jgi:hypothetical protein
MKPRFLSGRDVGTGGPDVSLYVVLRRMWGSVRSTVVHADLFTDVFDRVRYRVREHGILTCTPVMALHSGNDGTRKALTVAVRALGGLHVTGGLVCGLGFDHSKEMPIVRNNRGHGIYRMAFFARHDLPTRIWGDVAKGPNKSLPLFDD